MYLEPFKGEKKVTELGSILYSKRVMGHRILSQAEKDTKIGDHSFKNYGSHTNNYPFLPFMTFACAIGTQIEEITVFFERLASAFK